MLVSEVLDYKGRNVEYATSIEPLFRAGRHLTDENIGTLVVRDAQNNPVGILSERDVLQAIGRNDVSALSHPVSEFMNTPVITCREDDTIEFALSLMAEGNFRHIPVRRGDAICGILSAVDLMNYTNQIYCIADFAKDYLADDDLAA